MSLGDHGNLRMKVSIHLFGLRDALGQEATAGIDEWGWQLPVVSSQLENWKLATDNSQLLLKRRQRDRLSVPRCAREACAIPSGMEGDLADCICR